MSQRRCLPAPPAKRFTTALAAGITSAAIASAADAKPGTPAKTMSLGLGLAIVRRITDLHGGTVEVIPPRQGVKFRISIPEIAVGQPAADRPRHAADPAVPALTACRHPRAGQQQCSARVCSAVPL